MVNNSDVETPNPVYKPKLDINCKLVLQIWLVAWNVCLTWQNHSGHSHYHPRIVIMVYWGCRLLCLFVEDRMVLSSC